MWCKKTKHSSQLYRCWDLKGNSQTFIHPSAEFEPMQQRYVAVLKRTSLIIELSSHLKQLLGRGT